MTCRDIYIAIMVANSKGQGLHLSADEISDLAGDDAIFTRAENSLAEDEWKIVWEAGREMGWTKIDPKKERVAANMATGGNQ